MKKCSRCNKTKSVDHFFAKRQKGAKGQTLYYSPCKECRREAVKKSYQNNSDKYKERSKRWKSENADKLKASRKEYEQKNADSIKAKKHQWYLKNKDRVKAIHDAYVEKNRDKVNAYMRDYYKKNKKPPPSQQDVIDRIKNYKSLKPMNKITRHGNKIHIHVGSQIITADLEDLNKLKTFRWTLDTYGYPITSVLNSCILMGRFIMDLWREDNSVVHYADGNPLNNCKDNLIATDITNAIRSQKLKSNNTSGYKGIYPTNSNKWGAKIVVNYKQIHLGTFDTAEEAAEAYDQAAAKYYGEFARTNKDLGLL